MTTPTWRKSTYSSTGNTCVEMAPATDGVLVRDSKLGDHSPTLAFDRDAVAALIEGIKAGA